MVHYLILGLLYFELHITSNGSENYVIYVL